MKKITFLIVLLTLSSSWYGTAQITTYPYSEDFEAGDGGWTATNGANGTWALGAPTASVINSAASGANAWATNLSGNYNASENSFVQSPVFDLSTLSAPSIQFSIWWNSEFSWDGMVLQSSIDSGASWQNVGAFGDPNNWYNDTTINGSPGGQQVGWSGRGTANGSQGWVVARHALTGLAGQSNVILRFAFGSDTSVQDNGVAFDLVSVFEVTCPEPSGLAVDSQTSNTANISWAPGGSETDWEVAVQPAGTGEPSGAGDPTTSNAPYMATSLTPATAYEVYVRSVCGSELSPWVGPIDFLTECVSFIAPYTQGFENAGAIPVCWTMSGGEDWEFSNTGTGNHIGDNGTITGSTATNGYFAWVDSSGTDAAATLLSPLVDVSTLTTPALSFYEISDNEGNANSTLTVEVWDGAAWNNVGVYNTNTNGWELKTINLSGLTITGDVQARFTFSETVPGDFYDDIAIDDVTFDELPSCPSPSTLTATNITSNGAELGWTETGSATLWNIEIVPTGTPATGVPTASGVSNPYMASGLDPITSYDFYVQAQCGSDTSIWVGPSTFVTLCAVFTPDYLATFNTFLQDCWDEADNGDPTTGPTDLGDSSWAVDGFANVGTTGAYKINLWLAAKSDWLLSPVFDLTGGPFQVELDLAVMQFGSSVNAGTLGSDDQVQLLITTDAGATWTPLLSWDSTSAVPAGGDHYVFDLTTYGGQTVQFGIWASEGSVDDTADNDVSVDNFQVRNIPTCLEPSGLTSTNLSLTSTEVSWTENGSATLWNIEYGPDGFVQGTGTVITDVTNPYTIESLTPDTLYDFYVQANCGAVDGLSSWTGPSSFYTGYCASVPTSNDGQGVTNVTIGVTDFPSFGDVTYENHTATAVNVFQGVETNVSISFATGFTYGTNIWIDFNDNLVFEASEIVFQGESTNANPTILDATFTMPADAALGEHRMRIGTADFGQATPNPCFNGSFGVTLDFTVNIVVLDCVLPEVNFTLNPDCNNNQFFIDVDVTDLGSASSLTLTDNQGGSPQTVSTVGLVSVGPFPNGIEAQVTVTNDDNNNCVRSSGILTQEFCLDVQVDCAAGPLNISYCYINDDTNVFSYTSTDGSPLNLTINSGEIEGSPFDFLVILDSDGVTELYNGEGNDGDISGLTFQSTGDTIYFSVVSDFIISCESGSFPDGIDYTVACATCINPAATYSVIDDCDNGDQFLIDVNITSLGDATSLTVTDNQGSTGVQATAPGVVQMGPYPFGTPIIITVSNDQDVNCVINSSPIEVAACPPANDNCSGAIVATVNADGTCALITPGTVFAATPSGNPAGTCGGDPDDDVWFQFTALHENETISLQNISGGTTDLDHAVYSGSCGALTELYCSPNTASATSGLTIGQTYFIRVFSAGSVDATSTFDLCITESPGNVIVDQTTYTPEQLIQDVLINTPCAVVSNITFSTGTNYGQENGIGYFSGNGVGFPFTDGIILTTGDALEANGPNTTAMSSGTSAWLGDPQLNTAVGITNSNNATIIEFDFVPLADEISFDFLMASEEYNGGSFECNYSDAFAFLLTDENGITTNLAVLPGTTTPILVTNIHPENLSCPAINEQYFGGYTPQNLPPISFDGRTEVFTAYSQVNIGETYHIKLVIADATDSALDSGVYLKAGSFDLGEIELGNDITIEAGTAVCEGGEIILETNIPNVTHTWYLDGIELAGETSSTLVVTEPGEYTVQIVFSAQCFLEDVITIEFFPNPVINLDSIELFGCSDSDITTFNLQDNDLPILGSLSPAEYTVAYYLTEQEAIDGTTAALSSPYTNLSNPQTVWARVTNNTTACFETTSFDLIVNPLPDANDSPDVTGCDFDDDGVADYDITVNEDVILGGQTGMTVTYYTSQTEADAGTPVITNPEAYSTTLTTIYVRVENNATGCYNTTTFGLTTGEIPVTTFTTDFEYEVCPDATVPVVITATPQNYTASEVSIVWYQDGGVIQGETGLTLPVLEEGLYEIEVRFNETGCIGIIGQEVVELDNCIIPQGISPNNDGKNDTFDLSNFDVQRLEIFNRLGTLVYSRDNYTDEWHGQTDSGDELPVGTYFYTMVYEGGAKTRSSWVYINK